jgi:hypothetical protein
MKRGYSRTCRSLAVAAVLLSAPAAAQEPPETPPIPETRFRLGPLRVQPKIALTTGYDTNVFNEAFEPKEDIVYVLSPDALLYMKLGRARLEAHTSLSAEYFQDLSFQSSLNTFNQARLSVPLNRLVPFVIADFLYTRERPGLEIDTRPRRYEQNIGVGLDARLSGRTLLTALARRGTKDFEDSALFGGESLQQALNRESDGITLQARRLLTTMTSLIVGADAVRDRFEFSPEKDAESLRAVMGLDFKPRSALSGGFTVGYMRFDPKGPQFESFRGVVGTADVMFVLHDRARFTIRGSRDVSYSFEPVTPYYIQTGAALGITYRLGERWDLTGLGGHYTLEYLEGAAAATSTVPNPTQFAHSDDNDWFGGGAGFYLGRETRIGFSVEYRVRRSPIPSRDYHGMRTLIAVSHDF